ncbi:hypothetical protein ABZ530_10505 [Micrococcus luteus]|uniref:hypothetical protein n=1 Tax=Micrococcus luteus TaxID=1270 RepID=UPI0033DA0AA0
MTAADGEGRNDGLSDLDQDLQPPVVVPRRIGEGADAATLSTPTRRRVVSARHRIRGPFVPRGPRRVGDEDAVESGLGEDLGLTRVARGDSVGLRLDLAPTDLNALCVLTCGLTSRLCSAAKP